MKLMLELFLFYILLIWGVRTHPTHPPVYGPAIASCFDLLITVNFSAPPNTYGDSDVISFHIYASWFSPPSCG